ncbi:MAG: YihY family inner membrane protein [Gallionellaceae bacterium]|jgi:membrane protein
MKTAIHNFFLFVRFVVTKFRQDKCTQMAASLTFDTLLSLVPLITIALTLFSAFPVFADFSEQIKHFLLTNMLPETGGKMISRYVQQFAESATKLTTVGLLFLAVTAMLMMVTMDNAFNTIWRVSKPRPLFKRVLVYWAVLTLAPLLVGASLSLTSWLVGLSIGYAKQAPIFGMVTLKVVPVLLTTFAFSLLFRWIPNRHVPKTHALIGGIVAAVAFESMNRGFGFFISHFPTYKLVYGAFASVPIFLMWIYLSWLTVLSGALIAASLSRWKHQGMTHLSSTAKFYYAVRILGEMQAGLATGQVQSLSTLSQKLQLAFEETEALMEKLLNANIVRKLAGSGWTMIRDPEHINLYELTDLFLLDIKTLPSQAGDKGIHAWLAQVAQRMQMSNNATLKTLI